jgi:L-ascorbate metabolism protein UlaG (beta-lactamase superfamily)
VASALCVPRSHSSKKVLVRVRTRHAHGHSFAVDTISIMRMTVGLLGVMLLAQSSRPVEEFKSKAGVVKITPIRHASMMIEAGGKVIQVDPWSQGNFDGLPKADLILITDIHPDHLDQAAIDKVRKDSTVFIAPAAGAKTITSAKVLANGQSTTWEQWTIEAVPMYNLKRGPSEGTFFHDKGRGNGYVLTYGGTRFYISGDTEAIPEMRALKNIDVAFVCMNLPYTMTPEEAADGVRAFHPKIVYPYHYRGSDTEAFKKALDGTGIDVRLRNWYY